MPKVSVIVPVYKVEQYLHRCVNSILNQSFSDFELILVDDGSPDNCGAICDGYAAKDNRVVVIHQKNGGASSARNAGLGIATGTNITFIDSDDTVSDKYLEELMKWHDFDYVSAGYMWQDRQGHWHSREFEETNTTTHAIKSKPSKYLGKYYFGSPWATLMQRSIIEANSIRFDTTVHSGEDTLFILSYLRFASSIKIVSICGYHYHYHATSLVNSPHEDLWKWKILVEQSFLNFFNQVDKDEEIFLLDREFIVLRNLITDYGLWNKSEVLPKIFNEVFFQPCIAYKSAHGGFSEKVFIYFMKHHRYSQYKKYSKYVGCIGSLKYKVKKCFYR